MRLLRSSPWPGARPSSAITALVAASVPAGDRLERLGRRSEPQGGEHNPRPHGESTLRAEPDGHAAHRLGAHRALQLPRSPATAAAASSCASTTPTWRAPRSATSAPSSTTSRWLGLAWDEGPDVGGPYGPVPAERAPRAATAQAADELLAAGLAYRCFCSQERLERAAPRGARRRPPAALRPRAAWRLDAGEVAARLAAGEPAAAALHRARRRGRRRRRHPRSRRHRRRRASATSSSCAPTASPATTSRPSSTTRDMAITHVIRGDDHLTNTARQQLLRRALAAARRRRVYAHHSMILAPGRRQAVQAPRRHRGGRLPRARLPAPGDRQLPGPARLVARRATRCSTSSGSSPSSS